MQFVSILLLVSRDRCLSRYGLGWIGWRRGLQVLQSASSGRIVIPAPLHKEMPSLLNKEIANPVYLIRNVNFVSFVYLIRTCQVYLMRTCQVYLIRRCQVSCLHLITVHVSSGHCLQLHLGQTYSCLKRIACTASSCAQ